MSKRAVVLLGLAQTLGTTFYVVIVVIVLIYYEAAEKQAQDHPLIDYLSGVGLLLFFIMSASISSSLVFGYPVMLALRQQVKEAVFLVAATVLVDCVVYVGSNGHRFGCGGPHLSTTWGHWNISFANSQQAFRSSSNAHQV